MGYGNRVQGNIGVHDEIYVSTVVIFDGHQHVALLTADHTFIHSQLVDRIQSRVAAECPVPSENIFVCCSHTHAGPIGYADEGSNPQARLYIDDLVSHCVASVVEACTHLQPVSMHGGADEAKININRREMLADGTIIIGENPAGPVDHQVQTLQLRTDSGQVLATLVNYSCHPVVMSPLNRLVSADWVGAMRHAVELEEGGACLFFQGAAGDINPRKMHRAQDSWDEIEEQGHDVAAAVARACKGSSRFEAGPLCVSQQVVWLKLLPARPFDDGFRTLVPGIESLEEYQVERQKAFPWYVELNHREDCTYTQMTIGTVRLGEWALATMGTEPFCETGLALKTGSPARMTFIAGYSNGCNSYLPVATAYETGGYEVETAPLFYGLPAGYTPEGEDVVRRALLELLRN